MTSFLAELFAPRVVALNATKAAMLKEHGNKPIDVVTVATAFTGSRVQIAPCETSRVHPEQGVSYAGLNIATLRDRLPEEIFFLLLMGRLPDLTEKAALLAEITELSEQVDRAGLISTLRSMPKSSDPMALFTAGLMVLSAQSTFSTAYGGTKKEDLWRPALEDGLRLIAQVGMVAAVVWSLMNGEDGEVPLSEAQDLGGRLADMLDPTGGDQLRKLIRLHLGLHADHESGNASAFTASVIASTHATPFEAAGGASLALSGPLHGRASEAAFSFVSSAIAKLGEDPLDADIQSFVGAHLDGGKVVPGLGHAVLTQYDVRAGVLSDYGKTLKGGGPHFKMAQRLSELVPPILIARGKARNPWPNVDLFSGSLLATLGIDKPKFFTVMFATARALGIAAQTTIGRAIVLPLIRPESIMMAEAATLPVAKLEG